MTAADPRATLAFDERCVRYDVTANTWQESVRIVGDMLGERGFATPAYTEEMIDLIERTGPYVVVRAGIALVHAQPGNETLRNGLCAIRLAMPVRFGHAHYDPVECVIGLAVTTPEEHLTVVASLANALDDDELLDRIRNFRDEREAVREVIDRNERLRIESSESAAVA